MQICAEHWRICVTALENTGLWELVPKSGEAAAELLTQQLEGADAKSTFDPAMSMSMHWMNAALENGGLYLMNRTEDGANNGHYCPLCEYQKHMQDFVAKDAVEDVARQMAAWAREEGLLAPIQ